MTFLVSLCPHFPDQLVKVSSADVYSGVQFYRPRAVKRVLLSNTNPHLCNSLQPNCLQELQDLETGSD